MTTSQSNDAKLLVSKGWKLFNTCYCGGNYNEDYKNNDFEATTIRVTPAYNRFIINVHGHAVKRGNSGLLEALESIKQHI